MEIARFQLEAPYASNAAVRAPRALSAATAARTSAARLRGGAQPPTVELRLERLDDDGDFLFEQRQQFPGRAEVPAGGGVLDLLADVLHAGGADVRGAALQAVRRALDRTGIALRDPVPDRGDLRRRVLHEEQHQLRDHVGLILVLEEAELLNRLWIDGRIAGIHARRIGHGCQHHRLPRPDAIGAGPRAPQCGLGPSTRGVCAGAATARRDGGVLRRRPGRHRTASSRTPAGRLLVLYRCSTMTDTRRLRGSSGASPTRFQGLVVVHLEVEVHHRFEVERADAAHDDHAHRVGEEVDRVVVGEELREAREDRGRLRIVAVRLERHHARSA